MKNTFILIISSCETNWGKYGGYKIDYNSEIEYYIILDKGNTIYATDTKAEQLKKGIMVKFYRASGIVDSLILGKGAIIIGSFVDNDIVKFDNIFILVDQKPLEKIFGGIIQVPHPHWKIEPTKEALEKSSIHQYWIINKETDHVYGPFNKEQYISKKEELGVPKNIVLKFK